MRQLFILFILASSMVANAQQFSSSANRAKLEDINLKDSTVSKKWFISKYSGLSASFIGFRGGSASLISAPMGIQLNRAINNNFYAFAGLEIAPSYITMNPFGQAGATGKGISNSFINSNSSQFRINPAAFVGFGYINDARSFQLEARVSLQQGNYFGDPSDYRNFMNLDGQMRLNAGPPERR